MDGESKKGRKAGLVILLLALAHVVFYFAPALYLPVGLNELFILGYALVLADSGLLVSYAAMLLNRLIAGKPDNK